ncbi:EAL domain-containing protein, partial [Escherichia coli]|uniref:EAL domain-containing protein n=1 Tax=Escherichia coli TaxID=562 RepID=UPI001CEC2B5C
DRNRSHWSTSKTPSYTKSVSWQHHPSLSYLQDLDVDILKIDKSFVDALEYKNVTPHIIEMAKTLKLKMVAEGIETSKQEEWLRQHGVHYGQGWLYSKALPKEDFLRWAEQHL